LPQVLEFGPERRDKCKRRLAKDPKKFVDQFTRAVIKAQETPFLCGEGDRGWKADFDWFIANDRHVIRVLEGRYDSATRASPGAGAKTVFDKIRKERRRRKMDLIGWLEDLAAAYRIEPSEMTTRRYLSRSSAGAWLRNNGRLSDQAVLRLQNFRVLPIV